MGLLDSICRVCMQPDLFLKLVQPHNETMKVIYDIIFKSASVQVCRLCEQELYRLSRFLSLCSGTSNNLLRANKDVAACVKSQHRDKGPKILVLNGFLRQKRIAVKVMPDKICDNPPVNKSKGKIDIGRWSSKLKNFIGLPSKSSVKAGEQTSERLDFADKSEETTEDHASDNCSADELKDEVISETCHSTTSEVNDLLCHSRMDDEIVKIESDDEDANHAKDKKTPHVNIEKYNGIEGIIQIDEDIQIDEEKPHVNIEKHNESEGIAQDDEDIKIDYELLKDEPTTTITSEQSNNSSEPINKHTLKIRKKLQGTSEVFPCKIRVSSFKPSTATRPLRLRTVAMKCKMCDKHFTAINKMRRHMDKCHNEKNGYKCDTCGYTYKHMKSLEIHKLRHKKEEGKCEVCDFGFAVSEDLNEHLHIHSDPARWFTCGICNLKTEFREQYIRHVRKHKKFLSEKEAKRAS